MGRMKVIRHTEQQFIAEERPFLWLCLLALFILASAILLAHALYGGADWQMLSAAFFFVVSGYLMFSIDRIWIILDREENIAELRRGRIHVVISVDALMSAGVESGSAGHSLAVHTAIRNKPVLLASSDNDIRHIEYCAAALNAWLAHETPSAVPAVVAVRLDSDPLLT